MVYGELLFLPWVTDSWQQSIIFVIIVCVAGGILTGIIFFRRALRENSRFLILLPIVLFLTVVAVVAFTYLVHPSRNEMLAATVSIESNGTISLRNSGGKIIASESDSATIVQLGISAVAAQGGGRLHIDDGTYLIRKPISISGLSNIVIEGESRDGTILLAGKSGLTTIVKDKDIRTSNVVIRSLTLDGANISGKLMNMANIKNLIIDDIVAEHHNSLTPGNLLSEMDGVTVRNSHWLDPNSEGGLITVTGKDLIFQNNELVRSVQGPGFGSGHLFNAKILNNKFHDMNSYGAITLESHTQFFNGHSHENIEIAYNTFVNIQHGNWLSSNGYPGERGAFENINVHNNYVTHVEGGVRWNALDSKPNVVTNNFDFYENVMIDTSGISAGPLSHATFRHNLIEHTANWRGYGIYLYPGSDNVIIDDNRITDIEKDAYYYSGSMNIYIDGERKA